MAKKFLFTLRRSEYKTIEVEGTIIDQGIKYSEPYTSQIEELLKNGWELVPQVQRIE